ncbi:hypothetical protein THAOC_13110 [Thalassiosira oceanica]|uniref:Uncharacterized protein n=1 Tax=Thalassiosira oceanica TaxID=159749 RepID=K0SLZ1_THAOC|nr:hypothetical protein THAOC_13110 [Thalassiosira oceanica]|eukprot:EJK65989.1 hypothetical protein THAOC_13110 [Thalassiosira oceanica]
MPRRLFRCYIENRTRPSCSDRGGRGGGEDEMTSLLCRPFSGAAGRRAWSTPAARGWGHATISSEAWGEDGYSPTGTPPGPVPPRRLNNDGTNPGTNCNHGRQNGLKDDDEGDDEDEDDDDSSGEEDNG